MNFDELKDQRIPGGCDHCDAYQTMELAPPGVHVLTVHHDDDCPAMRSVRAGENR
jgi:hypothetical protein